MPDDEPDQQNQQPTQRTSKGLEIPIPTRGAVMDAIRRVSKPDEADEPSGS